MKFNAKMPLLLIGVSFWAGPAFAELAHCKYYPKAGLLLDSYEIIGPENCMAACTETEGCTAWSYTPHNFNPDNGPGWCRGMDDISDEVEDERDYCGRIGVQEFEQCSITSVDQVGYIDTFTSPEECVAACAETEGCDSWTFRPHSFDAEMPGQCKLIKGIYSKEESTSTYCGKL